MITYLNLSPIDKIHSYSVCWCVVILGENIINGSVYIMLVQCHQVRYFLIAPLLAYIKIALLAQP
jgi:hypothetical protein